jgi:hypothetical protein
VTNDPFGVVGVSNSSNTKATRFFNSKCYVNSRSHAPTTYEQVKGNIRVFLTSSTGKQMITANGDADKFHNYTISTDDLSMAPGLCLVQVKTADGRVEMKRAVKE